MPVMECDVPLTSLLDRHMVEHAYFRDAFCAPASRVDADIASVFHAIFSHHPLWMKLLLIVRNALASLAGLKAPSPSEILETQVKHDYAVGDTIGVWPIFAMSETEIVAGRDNKHLDFRVSVMKQSGTGGDRVIVTTICAIHNLAGKVYLFFVVPFHKRGVRMLLANAVAARRL